MRVTRRRRGCWAPAAGEGAPQKPVRKRSTQRCQRCGGCDALRAPATRHVLERLVVNALRHSTQLGVVARLRRARCSVSAAQRKRPRGVPWPKHPPRWRSAARAPSWAAPGPPWRADGARNWRRHRPGAVPSVAARVPSRPASRRAAAGRAPSPRARRRVASGTMSSEGDGSDKPAPTAPGADAAGGAKPIAEALQRLVMTSGASRRHIARCARRCVAARVPGFAQRRSRLCTLTRRRRRSLAASCGAAPGCAAAAACVLGNAAGGAVWRRGRDGGAFVCDAHSPAQRTAHPAALLPQAPEGPIDPPITVAQVRQEPYPLPARRVCPYVSTNARACDSR